MRTRHTYLNAILGAVVAASLVAVHGSMDDVAAQETEKSNGNEIDKSKSEKDSVAKTRKAACRCGNLSVKYHGPDPDRITLCHCKSCQSRTGTMFSVQGRFPREYAKIEGKSKTWTFPNKERPVTYKSCDSGGATYHFCPVCGTTVYWDIAAAPDVIGVAIGTLTDPTFPPPKISGFEAYGHPWAMNAEDLPIVRLEFAE